MKCFERTAFCGFISFVFIIISLFCNFFFFLFSLSFSPSVQPVDVDLSAEVEARLNLKEKETAAGPSLPSRSELITDTVRRGEEEFPRLTKVSVSNKI